MSDTDKLQIFYDDAATTQPISGTVTANAFSESYCNSFMSGISRMNLY